MTQLFDTTTYDSTTDGDTDPATGPHGAPHHRSGIADARRHLHSVPDTDPGLTDRAASWRLDDDTIEIGRRGLAKARQALEQAARDRAAARRRAA